MSNNKFSIIIPVFNTENYLIECLQSIQQQTYQNFEVILVNDGSTDSSGQICDSFSAQDKRFITIHTPNFGVAHARNIALDFIEKRNSEFVTFIDSDDFIAPTYLRDFATAMNQYNVNYACCANIRFFKDHSKKKILNNHIRILHNNEAVLLHFTKGKNFYKNPTCFVGSACKVYRKEIISKYRFDRSLTVAEDLDFILHVLKNIHKGIALHKGLYFYRQRKSSLSGQRFKNTTYVYFLKIWEKEFIQSSPIAQKFIEQRIIGQFWQYVLFSFRHSFINDEIFQFEKKEAKKLLKYCHSFKDYKRLFFVSFLPKNLLKLYILKTEKKTINQNLFFE